MSTSCHRCGAFDPTGRAFPRERIPFRGTRVYCPSCQEIYTRKVVLGSFAISGLFALIGLLKILGGSPKGAYESVNLFLVVAAMLLSVIPHELAHAAAGRSLGLLVDGISIGFGKPIWRGRIFGLEVDLRRVPMGGFALISPGFTDHLRARFFLTILAGPLVNAVILAFCWQFLSWEHFKLDERMHWAAILGAAQVGVLLENLVPYSFRLGDRVIASDGLTLFQLFFSKKPIALHPELWPSNNLWNSGGGTYSK